MNKGEKHMPETTPEDASGVIRNPELSIGSAIEAIKSSQKRNLFEANSLFVAKEALDVEGYTTPEGAFNEDLLRARAEQTVLPDGSKPTVEMIRDWFEAKKELTSAILDGKVDVGRPITQKNKDEAAYYKALNITRRREGVGAAEPHITDPEENRKIFEEAAAELEDTKVNELTFVVENWDDLIRERAHQLSEVREGKQTQTQDLNDFLKERVGKEEVIAAKPEEEPQSPAGPEEPPAGGPPQPPVGEGAVPAEPTEEAVPEGEETGEQDLAQGAGEEPKKPEEPERAKEEEEKPPEAEGEEGKKEEAKEEKKQGFFGKAGGFIKNWWKSVSPQGRNKAYWGLGVGVGAAETLFVRTSLTPILGPAASWAVSGVNALVLNGVNYRVQKGIAEARANQDLEKLQKLEAQYKKTADFFAGVAAGSIGAAVGDALWNGLVAPKLPQIQEGIRERFGIGAEATSPQLPVRGDELLPPPAEVPRPIDELLPPVETVAPAETMKHVVRPGDTLTDVLFNKGYEPYGRSLTDVIVQNADVLKARALNDAQRQAIDQLVANPNWIAIDDKEKWKIIMRAGHWIFPGQELILPVKP